MLPSLTVHNRIDVREVNPELCGDGEVCQALRPQRADLADLIFRQFGVAMLRTARYTLWVNVCAVAFPARKPFGMRLAAVSSTARRPALHHLVAHVIRICAQKQMIRAHAARIITAVQAIQSSRNGAERQFVTQTMGRPLVRMILHLAVTVVQHRTNPQPAASRIGRLLHVGPKAICQVATTTVVGTSTRAVAAFVSGVRGKGLSALAADMRYNGHCQILATRVWPGRGLFAAAPRLLYASIIPHGGNP